MISLKSLRMSRGQRNKSWAYQAEEHSRQGNNKYKGPETGTCLTCSGISHGQ